MHLKFPRLLFWLWYGLFWLNETVTKRLDWQDHMWQHLRLCVFEITGACQHSGNCCRSLMLVQKDKPVDTQDTYDALVAKNPTYARFLPEIHQSQIFRFRCTCLTPENTCNDYENRPKICHHYPMSMFVKVGHIHSGCGYRVQLRFYPKVRHPVFWMLLFRALRDNHIPNTALHMLASQK